MLYMLRTQVYLDEEDYKEVASLAALKGVKKAAMMRRVVKKGLRQEKKELKKDDDWKKEWFAKAKVVRDKGLSGWKGVKDPVSYIRKLREEEEEGIERKWQIVKEEK